MAFMKNTFPLLVLSCAILFSGCENTFEPKAEFQQKLVVYAIFDKSQAKQVVRLQSTYDAELTNPDKPKEKRQITDAEVFVKEVGGSEYEFVREAVEDPDSPVEYVWTSTQLIPTDGRTYTMRIRRNGIQVAVAQMQMPSPPYLDDLSIGSSESGGSGVLLSGSISTASAPKGFYFRLFVLGYSGDSVIVRKEVPFSFNPNLGEDGEYVYPSPSRSPSQVFPVEYVKRIRADIERTHNAERYTLLGIGYAMDTHFYNYYKTVRGFEDPVTVRQDNPDISNIDGGFGVFGGMYVQMKEKNYTGFIK